MISFKDLAKAQKVFYNQKNTKYVFSPNCVLQLDCGIKAILYKKNDDTCLLDLNDYSLNTNNLNIMGSIQEIPEITLDGYLQDDTFYIQDILQFGSINCSLLDFKKRWSIISSIISFGDHVLLAPIAFSNDRKNDIIEECIYDGTEFILKEQILSYKELKKQGYYSFDLTDYLINNHGQKRFLKL